MNTVIWRCDAFTEVPNSSLGVVLRENPNLPVKLVEAPPVKNDESTNIALKDAPGATVNERDASPAGIKSCASSVLAETPADTKRATISASSHEQERAAIEQELCASKLERKLCGAADDGRTSYCHARMSLFGNSSKDREGFKRLTPDVAQRFGFNWKFLEVHYMWLHCTRKTGNQARVEPQQTRSPKGGRSGVVDRFYKGDRMITHGVELQTMKGRDEFIANREVAPLPIYTISYNRRAKKSAC